MQHPMAHNDALAVFKQCNNGTREKIWNNTKFRKKWNPPVVGELRETDGGGGGGGGVHAIKWLAVIANLLAANQ